jgi:hypothetical protein
MRVPDISMLPTRRRKRVRLWDGSIGGVPPEPQVAVSLAERREACAGDVLGISKIIRYLIRNCDAAGVDLLIAMVGKPRLQQRVFTLSAKDRRALARNLLAQEGAKVDALLLREKHWRLLVNAMCTRAELLLWLSRYYNGVTLRP